MLSSFVHVLLGVLIAVAGSQAALAQKSSYPVKPMRMLVGFAAGGGNDLLARILAVKMTEALGQSVDLTHVPCKGTAPVLTDLLSGQIQFTAGAIPPTMPRVKSGRLRAIGVSTAQRSKLVPEMPTVAEARVPEYGVASWYAISGPPKMLQDIVARLNDVLKRILALPDIASRFENEGVDVAHGTPEEFAKLIKTGIDKWAKVAKAIKIKE